MHLSGIERGAFQKHAIFSNSPRPRPSAPICYQPNEFKQLARLHSRLFCASMHIESVGSRKVVEKRPSTERSWWKKARLFPITCASLTLESLKVFSRHF